MEPQKIEPTLAVNSSKKTYKHYWVIGFILVFSIVYIFFNFYVSIRKGSKSDCVSGVSCIKEDSDVYIALIDGTTDWKTYKDEQYGFEFKYPKDWTIDGEEYLFRVINMQDLKDPYKGIYVSIVDSNGMDIDKWLENYDTEFIDLKSKLTINGNSVVKSINSADGNDGFSYYFSNNKNVFKFEISKFYQKGNSFYDYDKYIVHILSTFKFIK